MIIGEKGKVALLMPTTGPSNINISNSQLWHAVDKKGALKQVLWIFMNKILMYSLISNLQCYTV